MNKELFKNIPNELQVIPQWVVAAPNKQPYNPNTMYPASVDDVSTGGSIEQAIAAAEKKGEGWGIGLILTEELGITVLDQDDKPEHPLTDEQRERQQSMRDKFDTYIERSRSGTGYHIVLWGTIPSGVHRDEIEMYSSGRYMIFTGDVVKDLPISRAYQGHLDNMYGQMKGAVQQVVLADSDHELGLWDDRDLVEKIMSSSKVDKFNALCNGQLVSPAYEGSSYISESEAVMALIGMTAFWTGDNEQVRRIVRYSHLGKREKYQRGDYHIDLCLKKIRANQPPPVDMRLVKLQAEEIIAKTKYGTAEVSAQIPTKPLELLAPLDLPPGLLGSMAQYFLSSANRPVREVALHAATALMATIAGRSYCTYGSPAGLNLYLILVAKTGIGKEDGKRGIHRLLNRVRERIPSAHQYICSGMFASGQALHKHFDSQPNFLWINSEIGHHLKRFMSQKAASADLALQRTLLDIYAQSGPEGLLGSHIHSDSEKTSNPVRSPAMSLMGETTPEVFYGCLDDADVDSGLIPRLMVVEYQGLRPPSNDKAGHVPTLDLIDDVCRLVEQALRVEASGKFITVKPDKNAKAILQKFNDECDEKINASIVNSGNSTQADLWNRAHLHAIKLASIVAVGMNPFVPIIDAVAAQWAIDFVRRSVACILSKFETGEAGNNPMLKGEMEIRKRIKKFIASDEVQRGDENKMPSIPASLRKGQVIPYGYISKSLKNVQPFKGANRIKVLNEILADMVMTGVIAELSLADSSRNGFKGRAFVTGTNW